MIYEQRQYVNDEGVSINGMEPVADLASNGPGLERPVTKYFAIGAIQVQDARSGATGQLQFRFEIPGDTIAQAFANFPEAFKTATEKAEADVAKQTAAPGLVIAKDMPVDRRTLRPRNGRGM
jgi:hypothetical protein